VVLGLQQPLFRNLQHLIENNLFLCKIFHQTIFQFIKETLWLNIAPVTSSGNATVDFKFNNLSIFRFDARLICKQLVSVNQVFSNFMHYSDLPLESCCIKVKNLRDLKSGTQFHGILAYLQMCRMVEYLLWLRRKSIKF